MRELIASEIRQRLRGRRWWVVLGVWFLALLGLLALTRSAAKGSGGVLLVGPVMFGSLALFILSLACLVVPSLTSGAINGERQAGTLAVLQASLLRPWEIFGAKLAAATITAAAFLAVTAPLALWCFAEGDVGVGAALVTYLILLLTCLLLAVLGLAASALVRRAALSAIAVYAVVFALVIGTPVLFGLSFIGAGGSSSLEGPETGWRWVILAPNPVIVLADAAPSPAPGGEDGSSDPLGGISALVRLARAEGGAPDEDAPPLWPTGLGLQVVLAGLASAACVARLRVPARRLRAGERVA